MSFLRDVFFKIIYRKVNLSYANLSVISTTNRSFKHKKSVTIFNTMPTKTTILSHNPLLVYEYILVAWQRLVSL